MSCQKEEHVREDTTFCRHFFSDEMSVTLDGVATTKTPVYTPLQQKTILKRWEQTWSYIHQLVSWFGMLVFLMVWNCSWCSLKNESTGMEKITSQFVRVMCCSYCQTQLEVAVFTQDWSRAHRKFEAELEQEIFPWIFWQVDLASIKPWYQSYDLWRTISYVFHSEVWPTWKKLLWRRGTIRAHS